MRELTHLSLFSGIGGLDLAAEAAGFRTVGQCEMAEFQTEVLQMHWPDVPRWKDVREVTADSVREELYMAAHRKDYDQAVQMYEMGMSIEQVADYYGVTRQSMWKSLQRRGVQFRDNKRYGDENHFYRGTQADLHAQDILEYAIRRGDVKRQYVCERCGATGTFSDGRTKIQAHHPDYNKPLDVMWLCQKCHHKWHEEHKAKGVVKSEAMRRADITVLSGGFP